MLGYVDDPGSRTFIRSPSELNIMLRNSAKSVLSTVFFIAGDYEPDIDSVMARVWNALTGNSAFIEDINSMLTRFRRGLLRERLTRELLQLLSNRDYSLTDLILMNQYMKLTTDMGIGDLGLLILYENPQSVMRGIREPIDEVPNRLITRELIVELEARCTIVRRSFYVHVIRQFEGGPTVLDWSGLGLIPYTRFQRSSINGVETADPVYASLMRHHARIVTKPGSRELNLVLPKAHGDFKCSEGPYVALPQSMRPSEYSTLMKELKNMGYVINEVKGLNLDDALDTCIKSI
jgi:hypothetical protein